MKVKAKFKKDKVVVKVLLQHPMETGLRKDQTTNELIPAKYVQEFTCKHKEKTVFIANFGRAVSKNTYLSFSFYGGAKGERLSLRWFDNMDDSKTVEVTIK